MRFFFLSRSPVKLSVDVLLWQTPIYLVELIRTVDPQAAKRAKMEVLLDIRASPNIVILISGNWRVPEA